MTALPEIEPQHLVVIGGGVAGLVAALDCARVGIRVTIVEASGRLGGAVAREVVAGIPVDTGAESYATRGGHVRALIDSLGLSDAVVRPAAPGAWVHLPDGRSEPMPKTGILGIPSVPLASDVVRVIGWRGALRAYLDRLRPVLTIGQENNLGRLVERRMGRAVLEYLVAPVTRGVYSAEPGDLEVARAAPGLNRALTTSGSLSGAVATMRAGAPAGAAVEGLDGGMYLLVEALEAELRSRDVEFVLGSAAVSLVGDESSASAEPAGVETSAEPGTPPSWRVGLADGREITADVVLVAVPEVQALELLAPLSDELAGEEPLGAPAVEIVTLVIDGDELDAQPRGTGVLVAGAGRGAGAGGAARGSGVRAKALTHSTAKWGWLSDLASDGHPHRHVIRLSYGRQGAVNPIADLTPTEVQVLAVTDASTLLGVELDPQRVAGITRTTWSGTLAGAAIGQHERAERVREKVSEIDRIDVAGAWLAGTGLASVVPDALAAAGRIRHRVVEAYRQAGLDLDGLVDATADDESASHTESGINSGQTGGAESASGYPGTVDR